MNYVYINQELKNLINSLVPYLDGWRLDEIKINSTGVISIIGQGGERIIFNKLPSKNKISLYFDWPKVNDIDWKNDFRTILNSGEELPKLNFSPTTNITRIANAINKIIPRYVDIYAECKKRRDDEISKREHIKNIVDAFSKIKKPSVIKEKNILYFNDFSNIRMGGKVEIKKDGRCDITFSSMPIDIAMRIMGLCG